MRVSCGLLTFAKIHKWLESGTTFFSSSQKGFHSHTVYSVFLISVQLLHSGAPFLYTWKKGRDARGLCTLLQNWHDRCWVASLFFTSLKRASPFVQKVRFFWNYANGCRVAPLFKAPEKPGATLGPRAGFSKSGRTAAEWIPFFLLLKKGAPLSRFKIGSYLAARRAGCCVKNDVLSKKRPGLSTRRSKTTFYINNPL